MASKSTPSLVGAPDPELKNSPIMEETDEEFDGMARENDGLDTCFFNNESFSNGEYVCSGSSELLRCESGVWIRVGACDPDNP